MQQQVNITENQLKVIKDKYLRDDPSVEYWLETIADNIALAELLYHPDITEQELFENVSYLKEEKETFNKNKTTSYYLHNNLKNINEQNENFNKFIKNLNKLKYKNENVKKHFNEVKRKFYDLISSWEFLPNSPTLMNAGRKLQQLSACFTEDQSITTKDGLKSINEINIGDYVLTASGKYKKVTAVMSRFTNSYRKINVWKLPKDTMKVTDEHPILVLNEVEKPEWKMVKDLKVNEYVALSYPKETKDIKKINLINYLDKNYVVKNSKVYKKNSNPKRSGNLSKQTKPIKNEIVLDSALLRLFGYYISEGDCDNDMVRFTFNSKEDIYINDVLNIFKKKFGIQTKVEYSKRGNWCNLRFHSKIVANLFLKLFGKGFNKKTIPSWILTLPIEKQKGLLIGIFRGDGFPIKNRHTTNLRVTMYNQNTVHAVWTILARIGIIANFKKDSIPRLGTTNPFTCIATSYKMGDFTEEIFPDLEVQKVTQLSMQREMVKYVDGIYYLPIKDITIIAEPTIVYNFEVEDEHTYVANNIAVHNCYVVPVPDSIEGIYDAVKAMAIIHKAGGGTGFSFSRLRPSNDEVMSTKGVSSGPISFMTIFDRSTEVVKQGGTRRGANMGILRYDHPDIMKFITCKKDNMFLENFNISVAIEKKFMDAVKNNQEYDLINPNTKQPVARLNAKEVFEAMCTNAWETGDPGFVVIDRINNTDSNPTPKLGQIEATNPCIVGDTLISTEQGLVKMEQLVSKYSEGGIEIATDNRVPIEIKYENGTSQLMQSNQLGISFDAITKVFSTGIKDIYKLTTNSGYELKATSDHKLLTNNDGIINWIAIKDLDLNKHKILIQSGEGKFNENNNLPFEVIKTYKGENGRIYNLNLPTKWSKELGQVLGWLIGDGWLRESENKGYRVGFVFSQQDKDVLNHLKPILNSYYGNEIKEVTGSNKVQYLSYQSRLAINFFKSFGVKPVKAAYKVVPETIFTAPKEAVIGFLQGLFTADGTVNYQKDHSAYIRLTSKSTELLKGVQLLLLNLGIKSTIYNRSRKERELFQYTTVKGEKRVYQSDGIYYELEVSKENVIKFVEKIGFIKDKHKDKIQKLNSKTYYKEYFEEKIKSINFIGKQEVYDLTEPRTLSFITNGFVSLDCGEKPLLPWEPCNLGSINLAKFVDENDMDWQRLREATFNSIHFLENVIDINNYPLPQIEVMAKGNRRIGLGVMGLAETLTLLKIPYNSEKGFKKGEEIMKFINYTSLECSIELAKTRGVFPNWKDSIFDPKGEYFREKELYPRHCVRTTIAPTGTIAITAGLQGSGIEPFFAIVYVRYNAAGIDALRASKKPLEKDIFYEVNPIFKNVAEENDYFGLSEKELFDKIEKNHKSVLGIKEIPENIQKIFLTSHDLNPMDHVRMQSAFQRHTDDAVSKTVNLRNEATIDDVREVYMKAYEMGCKGVTIYRDGSKSQQVLNLSEKKVEQKKEKSKKNIEMSEYNVIETGQGRLHLHINYDENGPTRIFANMSPTGTEISGLTTALSIVLSKYLEDGGDPVRILKHLNSIKGDRPFGFGAKRIDSIPHGISKTIREHLIRTGKIKEINGQTTLSMIDNKPKIELESNGHFVEVSLYCSKCYSSNVGMISGCSEPTCFDCGYSKCS